MADKTSRQAAVAPTPAPTATRTRPARIPGLLSSSVKGGKKAARDASASKKKGGSSAGLKIDKMAVGEIKKIKRKQSSDAKARKLRLAAKMKRGNLGGKSDAKDDENDEKPTRFPKNAPKPEKIYNDELKSEAMEYEAERICDSRLDSKDKREYFVKWVGWKESANTWEPEVNLRNSLELISDFDKESPESA